MTANTEVVNGQLRLTAAAQRKIMQEFQTSAVKKSGSFDERS